MADYNIKAEITADASGFESGVKKAEKASKKLSTTVSSVIKGLGKNGLVGALGAVGLASSGLSATLGSVVKIARKVSETMNECTNAYKAQLIAERELDTAIQNNPFITGASADALKQFASEMQKVSNYGDEELIPMMANLVSLGRTEAETMQIMSVAMDMSAGMGISLDSAITQLNATLNGNIGRLGQQNAELKGLTEEELKQGKAIEILGEKFKGLSSATADTSKQLQNIKGDFKEALGQFTLPSSDMWNKFWAGFYERGIEVINKLNAFIDAQTIGKKLAGNFVTYFDSLTGDIGDKLDYIEDYLAILSESELQALNNYLSGLRKATDVQKIILKESDREIKHRALNAQIAKEEAEDKKKQAVVEEQITAELQKQEEIASKKTDWSSKLLDQRIEMLETERDRAMQYAEEEGQETYSIWIDYNNKILELKLERLEKEKEKALEEEGLTAEDKIAIGEYYNGETKKIYDELGRYKKKKNKEEEKDEKSKLAKMVEYAKQYAEKIKQVFSKVASIIKNVISKGVNIFKSLFDFNIDEALDVILVVEDNILTFFVETLPRLPRFVQSVLQSIRVLLKNLKNIIKRENVSEAVFQMLKAIGDNLPEMIEDLLDILEKVVGGALDGLLSWLDSEGIVKIFQIILTIQRAVEKFVVEALENIATVIENHVDDVANFLAESLASANRTLPRLIKSILRIIIVLVEAIAKAFENEDFVNSIVESIEGVIDAIIELLPRLISSIIKLIFNIISAIIPRLPEIILYVVQAIGEALPNMAGQIAGSLSNGISRIFSSIFTVDFWGSILQGLGESLAQIIKSALTLGFDGFNPFGSGFSGSGGSSGGSSSKDFDPLDFVDPLGLRHLFGFANGTNGASKGLAIVGEAGPELVRFNGGEQVLNNRNTQKALAGTGGKSNTFNVTFNNLQDTTAFSMMQQLKAYNRQMAINGVI